VTIHFMRSLTVTQPWAGLIAAEIKLIENRRRPLIKRSDFGKPFAIHASREIDEAVYDRCKEIVGVADGPTEANRMFHGWGDPEQPEWQRWYRLTRITSAVIAVATIDAVLITEKHGIADHDPDARSPLPADQRRWFLGPVGYVLRDVRVLDTPVACRGWQGFWYLTPKEQRERGQVSSVERAVQEQVAC